MFSRDGRYEMDVESAFSCTQCNVGTDAVIRQRNVGITEEE